MCPKPDAARWWGGTATFNGTIGLRLLRTNCAIAQNGLAPCCRHRQCAFTVGAKLERVANQGDIERARDALHRAPRATQLIATEEFRLRWNKQKGPGVFCAEAFV